MAVELESTAALEKLYADIQGNHMTPLWNVSSQVLPREPASQAIPYIWRRESYWPLCQRAGELVPIDRGGDRRVLAFINPGFPAGKYATTQTLWAAVQYLLPGEIAPDHRHSPAAVRFIMQGRRGFTTVNDDKVTMGRGDLVLTPAGSWHGHGLEGDEPMIWMDSLDIPLVQSLEAGFFESILDERWAREVEGETRLPLGHLKPVGQGDGAPGAPIMSYTWEKTQAALQAQRRREADPFDDVVLEYVNPFTGGAVLPTMAARIQLIRPGIHTRGRRRSSSGVYHVFEGSGYSILDGERFSWKKGDFFCVPTWVWHEHANESAEDAILFSIHDTPVMKALGLYREEARA